MENNYYQDTAFNSSRAYQLPPRGNEENLIKKFLRTGSRQLPFTNPKLEVSIRVDTENKPGLIEKLREIKPSLEPFWNQEELQVDKPSNLFQVYYLLSMLGKSAILFFLPIVVMVCMLYGVAEKGNFVDNFVFVFAPFLQWLFLPSALLWLQAVLVNRGHWSPTWLMTSKKLFTLNRRTGMVTLYKGNGKVRYSHPLVEFDCVLVSAPSQQGLMNYSLMLAHRYNGSMHGVPLSTLATPNESVAEYYRIWNMILCYMDISQPLPDCLILEESRHLDPVTAEYDKKIGRNPRYWRDMSEEEYKASLEAIRQRQQGQPETGPELNIFSEAV